MRHDRARSQQSVEDDDGDAMLYISKGRATASAVNNRGLQGRSDGGNASDEAGATPGPIGRGRPRSQLKAQPRRDRGSVVPIVQPCPAGHTASLARPVVAMVKSRHSTSWCTDENRPGSTAVVVAERRDSILGERIPQDSRDVLRPIAGEQGGHTTGRLGFLRSVAASWRGRPALEVIEARGIHPAAHDAWGRVVEARQNDDR
jgi:hypothetical protein